jgi:hypothetical protein
MVPDSTAGEPDVRSELAARKCDGGLMADNHRKLSLLFAIAAACGVSRAALAHVCPINECDYGDPQYQANYEKYKGASDVYQKCIDPLINSYFSAVDRLAIIYPRFGIAYRAMQDEQKAANNVADAANAAGSEAAHKAFDAAVNKRDGFHANEAAESAYEAVDGPAQEEVKQRYDEAKRRFEDRILHTAEPEALELYNLYHLKLRQQTDRCGPIPSPPQPPRK